MDPVLEKIDKALEAISATNTETRGQVSELLRKNGELEARLALVGEQVRAHDAWRNQVEARYTSNAHGGDLAVLDALTAEQRAWIPFVSAQKAAHVPEPSGDLAKFESEENAARLVAVKNALANFAQRSPVLYVGVASWFQAKIKAALASKNSQPKSAGDWSERADKIAESLGGFHPLSKAAMQEDTAAEGGYLVPTMIEAVIGWLMKEASVVRRAGATVFPMTSKTHNLPSLANDFTVSWTAEEGTITDATPATPFGSGSLVAKKQTGLVTVSIELIQDNVIGLMDFVMAHLIQQVGRAEDAQALEGDGTTFTGLFAASGTNSIAGGSNALTFDELVKLVYAGEHQSTIDNGVIFCHPWIVRDAIQLITGTAGTPWLPFSVQNDGRPRNLLGVPTYPTSTILRNRGGGTNETTAYHGNPQFIVIGDRMGTAFDVNPWSETEFKKGQVLLRLMRRVGILIWVPGYYNKLTAVTLAA